MPGEGGQRHERADAAGPAREGAGASSATSGGAVRFEGHLAEAGAVL